MPIFKYAPPQGDVVYNASIDQVVGDILEKGEEYWSGGDCFGVLSLGRFSTDPYLVVAYKDGYGFYIEVHHPRGNEDGTFFPKTSESCQDVVRLWVGQNYLRIPRAFFVSRPEAATIARTFAVTGELAPIVVWADRRKVGWVFYDPDEDDE